MWPDVRSVLHVGRPKCFNYITSICCGFVVQLVPAVVHQRHDKISTERVAVHLQQRSLLPAYKLLSAYSISTLCWKRIRVPLKRLLVTFRWNFVTKSGLRNFSAASRLTPVL